MLSVWAYLSARPRDCAAMAGILLGILCAWLGILLGILCAWLGAQGTGVPMEWPRWTV
jgi:hypothetical protein